MTVLTNDIRDHPNVERFQIQEHAEINAPAFCDPGTKNRSNGTLICSRGDVLRAIASRPLAFEPWTRPLYSNTGFNLLGWATAQAASKAMSNETNSEDHPITLERLLQKDVFEPLGMKATSFLVPVEQRSNVAVPSKGVPTMIDWDFTSTFNP